MNSDILFILISSLFLLPITRQILEPYITYLFYAAFMLEDAVSEIFYLKMQRDELLKVKTRITVRFSTDTLPRYPVRFRGYCRFINWNTPSYPSFIKVVCDSQPSEKDIIWATGMVGFVVKSEGKFAEVQTVHSTDFYAFIVDKRSMVMGILKGGKVLRVEYIPYGSDIKQGDTLSLKEHPGVDVGVVKYIYPSPPFITVEVQPLWRYEVWTKFSLLKPLKIY